LNRHLVVFVREPRIGRVKSRLARDIGCVGAWAFYRRTLAGVLRRLGGDGRWQTWLAVTPDCGDDASWPRTWRVIGQGRGDLGRRMDRAMRVLPPGPAVIVGTDIPDLCAAHVARGFRALGDHDAVFGPAADGGYWLVGLRRSPRVPEAFTGVRWSSQHALADTLANLAGLEVAFLETLDDVDDSAALARWRQGQR